MLELLQPHRQPHLSAWSSSGSWVPSGSCGSRWSGAPWPSTGPQAKASSRQHASARPGPRKPIVRRALLGEAPESAGGQGLRRETAGEPGAVQTHGPGRCARHSSRWGAATHTLTHSHVHCTFSHTTHSHKPRCTPTCTGTPSKTHTRTRVHTHTSTYTLDIHTQIHCHMHLAHSHTLCTHTHSHPHSHTLTHTYTVNTVACAHVTHVHAAHP